MSKRQTRAAAPQSCSTIRCAIYTRKSTEEGLEQDFNTLDAQRESAECYVKSLADEGWSCLPDRYDDGGFTGGNMDRPALRRLLLDIEGGKIDCVVVYKVDRLSRSILDFTRMLELFEKHQVSFVSLTQQINTHSSAGRLMLHVLLSFAQFERELISERTRDKIAAARRKGKWSGGHPLLGYDVDPRGFRLVVNEDEAARVRTIFDLYLEHHAMLPVVQELERRGWLNKRWVTRKGQERGGQRLTKTTLYRLLTNPVYAGKIRYKCEVHKGEHQAIVDHEIWQKVQAQLARNGRTGGTMARNKFGALLKGLIHCVPCGCAMTPSHSKNGTTRYRYYVCTNAQKRGWQTCPSKSIPAGQIEQFVVDQIKRIGRDAALVQETVVQAEMQSRARVQELETERRGLERDIALWHGEIRGLASRLAPGHVDSQTSSRLADLQERICTNEQRATAIRTDEQVLRQGMVGEHEVAQALGDFTAVWEALTPHEQARVLQLLVERVDYDGAKQKVSLTFHPTGIKTLAGESAQRRKEIA